MTFAALADLYSLRLAALAVAARAVDRRTLRPVAASLVLLSLLDAGRLLSPPRALDVALYATWHPVTAAIVVGALSYPSRSVTAPTMAPGERWRWVASLGAAWWAAEVTKALLLGARGAALTLEWAALYGAATAVQRRGGMVDPRRVEGPSLAGKAATVGLMVTAGSLADAVGPWAAGAEVAERWEIARWQSFVTWIAVAVVALWKRDPGRDRDRE